MRKELHKAAGRREPVALVALDLDDFKAVNDAHGHPFGDGVLRESSASSLRKTVSGSDIAARIGGEEFALIVPGPRSEAAHGLAERVRTPIARLSPAGSELSCSAGVAVYPVDADDAGTLLQLAEGALYWAKDRASRGPGASTPATSALSGDQPPRTGDRALLEGGRSSRSTSPSPRSPPAG